MRDVVMMGCFSREMFGKRISNTGQLISKSLRKLSKIKGGTHRNMNQALDSSVHTRRMKERVISLMK